MFFYSFFCKIVYITPYEKLFEKGSNKNAPKRHKNAGFTPYRIFCQKGSNFTRKNYPLLKKDAK